jgi:hypothetical protein
MTEKPNLASEAPMPEVHEAGVLVGKSAILLLPDCIAGLVLAASWKVYPRVLLVVTLKVEVATAVF